MSIINQSLLPHDTVMNPFQCFPLSILQY